MSATVYVAFAMLFVVCIVLNILAWRAATRLGEWAQGKVTMRLEVTADGPAKSPLIKHGPSAMEAE